MARISIGLASVAETFWSSAFNEAATLARGEPREHPCRSRVPKRQTCRIGTFGDTSRLRRALSHRCLAVPGRSQGPLHAPAPALLLPERSMVPRDAGWHGRCPGWAWLRLLVTPAKAVGMLHLVVCPRARRRRPACRAVPLGHAWIAPQIRWRSMPASPPGCSRRASSAWFAPRQRGRGLGCDDDADALVMLKKGARVGLAPPSRACSARWRCAALRPQRRLCRSSASLSTQVRLPPSCPLPSTPR